MFEKILLLQKYISRQLFLFLVKIYTYVCMILNVYYFTIFFLCMQIKKILNGKVIVITFAWSNLTITESLQHLTRTYSNIQYYITILLVSYF